jgi:hypothetical protein
MYYHDYKLLNCHFLDENNTHHKIWLCKLYQVSIQGSLHQHPDKVKPLYSGPYEAFSFDSLALFIGQHGSSIIIYFHLQCCKISSFHDLSSRMSKITLQEKGNGRGEQRKTHAV